MNPERVSDAPPPATWLVFDVGTTGVKAALLTAAGEVLQSAYQGYPTHTGEGGAVEQRALDWWEAALAAAARLDAGRADAVALTGQMQNLLLIDGHGEPLRPVILYSDARAHREAALVTDAFGGDRLTALTGNEQGASGLLAKLWWLREHDAGALEAARRLLPGAADFLAFRLTGRAVTDTTTASTTGLMDLARRDWLGPDELRALGAADVRGLLPTLVPGGTRVGAVTPAAGRVTGVREGAPVFLGPGDAASTTLGVGSGAPGRPYAYIGTSGWVAYSSAGRGEPTKGVFTLAHPDPGLFVCVAPLLTAGGNFDWIRKITGATDHATMIREALTRPATDLLYLPYLRGERSPISDPHARGAFIGLDAGHDALDLTRAVLEGVAFAYRHALEALVSEPIDRLALTGGGARSRAFCGLLADVTGLRVAVPGDAVNAGLRGALEAARATTGVGPLGAALQQGEGDVLEPRADLHAVFSRKFEGYLRVYPALENVAGRPGSTR